MVEEVSHTSIPANIPCVHLEDDIPRPTIVDFKESKEQIVIDSANNVNLKDITVVHPQITGVDYTTSDVPTPVIEPIPDMIERDNTEYEEGYNKS